MTEEQRKEQHRLAMEQLFKRQEAENRWRENARTNPRPGLSLYGKMYRVFHGLEEPQQ